MLCSNMSIEKGQELGKKGAEREGVLGGQVPLSGGEVEDDREVAGVVHVGTWGWRP